MLVLNFLFAVLAFSHTTTAAFFYYPDWRCAETLTCTSSKRSESEDTVDGSVTLRLKQRNTMVLHPLPTQLKHVINI